MPVHIVFLADALRGPWQPYWWPLVSIRRLDLGTPVHGLKATKNHLEYRWLGQVIALVPISSLVFSFDDLIPWLTARPR